MFFISTHQVFLSKPRPPCLLPKRGRARHIATMTARFSIGRMDTAIMALPLMSEVE
jgi:hypothetical protein